MTRERLGLDTFLRQVVSSKRTMWESVEIYICHHLQAFSMQSVGMSVDGLLGACASNVLMLGQIITFHDRRFLMRPPDVSAIICHLRHTLPASSREDFHISSTVQPPASGTVCCDNSSERYGRLGRTTSLLMIPSPHRVGHQKSTD
ncbi:unnamed protein product [Protopolystoma xenopodis]|uniref:Uncharacterized protein n=1 Tax=Protopolystoma xenopodis TaxID=117903 RepID=A0A448XL13_9PLAT|nr:unnamed protein product [Protopolystoma xenopodis]